jgi:hypothetical protein
MVELPSHDQLGPPNLQIAGFRLWVHGREFPESHEYDDGNWLRITAHCGAEGASVWVSGSIIQVMDITGFAKECEALENGSKPAASLAPHEPELNIGIVRTDLLGHFDLTVEITANHLQQEHRFRFEIDQSYMANIVNQCREIENSYPVRNGSTKGGV